MQKIKCRSLNCPFLSKSKRTSNSWICSQCPGLSDVRGCAVIQPPASNVRTIHLVFRLGTFFELCGTARSCRARALACRYWFAPFELFEYLLQRYVSGLCPTIASNCTDRYRLPSQLTPIARCICRELVDAVIWIDTCVCKKFYSLICFNICSFSENKYIQVGIHCYLNLLKKLIHFGAYTKLGELNNSFLKPNVGGHLATITNNKNAPKLTEVESINWKKNWNWKYCFLLQFSQEFSYGPLGAYIGL